MATECCFRRISPPVLKQLSFHPSIVDLFMDADTLQENADNSWQGIELLREDWEEIDRNLNKQQPRITRAVYEHIKPSLPAIIEASSAKAFCVGHWSFWDWLVGEGIEPIPIGNDGWHGQVVCLFPHQVKEMA